MTPPKKPRISRERPVQVAVVDYLRAVLPDAITHHCRNEINQSGTQIARELAKAKRAGAVEGFPDILVLPFAQIGPMLFEVKAPGNYPSPVQRALHADLTRLGYRVAVVRGIDDVRAALAAWGIATRERAGLAAMGIEVGEV